MAIENLEVLAWGEDGHTTQTLEDCSTFMYVRCTVGNREVYDYKIGSSVTVTPDIYGVRVPISWQGSACVSERCSAFKISPENCYEKAHLIQSI